MAKQIKFNNQIFSKKELKDLIYDAFTKYGITRACSLADDLKDLGFNFATKAGISISIEDLKIPPTKKSLLLDAANDIKRSDLAYSRGDITSVERFQKVIETWNKTSETLKNELVLYFRQTDPLNSIYLMAFSGARGNLSQVRQLVGMRGLMSDPNGQIIDIPIIHNFREGLTITDYIMSSYGARKGVVDTALRTADSGYLTRRLIDVAQDVIIRESNCLTKRCIKIYKKDTESNYVEKILGRTVAENIFLNNELIIKSNQQITHEVAEIIVKNKIYSICLHSPLTCESTRSICQKCYGWNLASGKLVSLGEAIGIIAAQSIGEPGTQLTMRTFHTGGIFTADPSRQIRAKETGLFSFQKNIQKKSSRTIYGSEIEILERASTFTITNFKNNKIPLKLVADSSVFVKNKTFVKINDLIAELPFKNRQTVKSRKNIVAPHAGEVRLFPNSFIIWILKGEVKELPFNSLSNKFHLNQKLSTRDNWSSFKVIAKNEGFVNIHKNSLTKKIETLKITKCFQYFEHPIFWDKKSKNLILKKNEKERYILKSFLITDIKNKKLNFAYQATSRYKTKTGGQILYPDNSFCPYDSIQKKEIIKKNGKILFIPIETHRVNKDRSLLLVTNKTNLPLQGTELVKGIFSKIGGFLQTKEIKNILHEIQIKPGQFYEYPGLSEKTISKLKKINKKIYFPGEIIFEDILITYITLVEVIKTKNSYGVLLRPIQEFNIPKPKDLLKSSLLLNQTIDLDQITYLKLESGKKTHQKKAFNLIESVVKSKKQKFKFLRKIGLAFYLICREKSSQHPKLTLMYEENINLSNLLSKRLNEEKLNLSLFIKNFDYVESQSILGLISLSSKKTMEIKKIQHYTNKNRNSKKLLISSYNYHTYFSENSSFLMKKNQMVRIGDHVNPVKKLAYSGQIIFEEPFNIIIHKGIPFFLTPETKLYKKTGNLIRENELLGIISFEQIVTGDIVQGLPKIEEILEARKPQNPAFLAKTPGIINKIQTKTLNKGKNLVIKLILFGNKKINSSVLENYGVVKNGVQNIMVKKMDYIYLGQPLTNGSVNPHTLLILYFNYYNKFFTNYEAAYLSFKNIQLLLIQKVQQVYNSQGVSIADKHLEVIIRRITSKVQILDTINSFLLPGEIIELKQVEYINLILYKSFKELITYSPILLGITKASLMTESFIAAASFQETTKILTTAAIEGKIDWLRGLKENVIIGRLIPVGTGFQ
jgi:DNA-directed RNA polymerase subunit beta'